VYHFESPSRYIQARSLCQVTGISDSVAIDITVLAIVETKLSSRPLEDSSVCTGTEAKSNVICPA
jgi:hypothetical protein